MTTRISQLLRRTVRTDQILDRLERIERSMRFLERLDRVERSTHSDQILERLERVERSMRAVLGRLDLVEPPESDRSTLEILPGTPYSRYAIPVEYPPSRSFEPRWGYSQGRIEGLAQWFAAHNDDYREFLGVLRGLDLSHIPHSLSPTEPLAPAWLGGAITAFDCLALYAIVRKHSPKLYLEIGSGMTTCFARQAITDAQLRTKVVSIDPQPRREVDAICDQRHPRRFGNMRSVAFRSTRRRRYPFPRRFASELYEFRRHCLLHRRSPEDQAWGDRACARHSVALGLSRVFQDLVLERAIYARCLYDERQGDALSQCFPLHGSRDLRNFPNFSKTRSSTLALMRRMNPGNTADLCGLQKRIEHRASVGYRGARDRSSVGWCTNSTTRELVASGAPKNRR